MDLYSASLQEPRLQFWAVRLDLTNPSFRILVGPHFLERGKSLSITPSSFARLYNCLITINATPFYPASAQEGEIRQVVGLVVYKAEVLSQPNPKYAALCFREPGSAFVMEQRDILVKENQAYAEGQKIQSAVGGFFIVLWKGGTNRFSDFRSARSAAGVNATGTTLYLLVIDGNRWDSVGATGEETGLLLQYLGATDGLLLDGGGSTSLVIQKADSFWKPVNVPMHLRAPHTERAVAVCLGVQLAEP
ncbi:MAG: phosphodiester glycosidase family protein [Spirochaetales bacterium]